MSVSGQLGQRSGSKVDDTVAVPVVALRAAAKWRNAWWLSGLQYRARYSVIGTEGRMELERAYSVLPDAPTVVALETKAGTRTNHRAADDQFRLMIDDFPPTSKSAAAIANRILKRPAPDSSAVMDAAGVPTARAG